MIRCPFCDQKNPTSAKSCGRCGADLPGTDQAAENSLESTVRWLLGNGNLIEAIKVYRSHAGASLADAKAAVEAIQCGESAPARPVPSPAAEQDVASLVRSGRKIEAIKLHREKTGAGLADAKAAVDALERDLGMPSKKSGCATALLGILLIGSVLLAMT